MSVAPATADAVSSDSQQPLLDVRNLVMHFPLTQGIIFQKKVGAVQAVAEWHPNVPGAASHGRVLPTVERVISIARGPSSTITSDGPEVM